MAQHSMGLWHSTHAGMQRWIALFGNPIVWWSALAGIAVVAVAALRRAHAFREHRWALAFLAGGYVMNFLPFAFIHRPMYLYHYLVALLFGLMLAALGIGALLGWTDDPDAAPWTLPRRGGRLYAGLLAAAALLFAYMAPMSYGSALDAGGVVHRRWILERNLRP